MLADRLGGYLLAGLLVCTLTGLLGEWLQADWLPR